MKKIISFSLWGDEKKYRNNIIKNIEEAKEIYPDWVCRFYFEESISVELETFLLKTYNNVEIERESYNGYGPFVGLFWRFKPIEEPDVSITLVRDVDSILNYREQGAVNEWLESDYKVHTMRDHIEHTIPPIMGGMLGVKGVFNNLWGTILECLPVYDLQKLGSDQYFLKDIIWDLVREKTMAHDRYYKGVVWDNGYKYDPILFFKEHKILPFPNHKAIKYGTFVGERIQL